VAPQEQLDWEARNAQRAGIAAIAAGVLVLVSTFYAPLFGSPLNSARDFDKLLKLHDHPQDALVPAVLQAIAYPLAAVALVYLYKAAKARRPETLRITYVLAIVGPVAVGIASLLYGIAIVDLAGKVHDLGLPNGVTDRSGGVANLVGVWSVGEIRAKELTSNSTLFTGTAILDFAANLAYGFALVLIGLNSMRAGLVSRFIGVLGIVAGAVTVLFRGSGPIEAFWLMAVGLMILDRWPNGRGPAWETGEAVPWPTAMDRQRALMEKRGEVPESKHEAEPEYEDEAVPDPSEPAPQSHPVSRKRKRKRRR
jgi:hypothetical protein